MKSLKAFGRLPMVITGLILALLLPTVLGDYDMHVLMLGMLTAMVALGLNFTLGYIGQPNFGQAVFLGFGAYSSALLTVRAGVPFWVSLIGAIIMSGIAGFAIGYVSLQLRGAYFCMVTIAIGQVFMLLSSNLVSLTGGPMGIAGVTSPQLFGILPVSQTLWVLAILLIALMVWLTWMLEHSVMGRAWIAIRESETLGLSLGINSFRYALIAYIVGALFAGAGGSLYAHYVGFVDPTVFAFTLSSTAVVSLVIGGRATIWGPVIGAILVTLAPEYLRMADLWRLPMFGLVVILIIVFMPDGLASFPKRWRARREELARPLTQERS